MKKKAKPAKSKRSKSNGNSKLVVVNVKMSTADRSILKAYAKRWAAGNLSAWVRHTGRRYTPKKGEKISLKAA